MNTQKILTEMNEIDISDVSEIVRSLTESKIKFIPIPCKNNTEFSLMTKIMKTRMKNIIEMHKSD